MKYSLTKTLYTIRQAVFIDSKQNSGQLKLELEKIGLTFQKQTKNYKRDYWEFSCLWKQEDSIKIIWYKTFTEDTNIDLDDKVEFQVNQKTIGTIDISYLTKK